jgi:hypothetical protein
MQSPWIIAGLSASLLTAPLYAQALEWSCADMKGFSDSMYEATDYLNSKPDFDENPRIEEAIDSLIEILAAIAKDEDIPSFSDALDEMNAVWQKEEWHGDDIGDFRRAMDSVTVNLERIYEKYCR